MQTVSFLKFILRANTSTFCVSAFDTNAKVLNIRFSNFRICAIFGCICVDDKTQNERKRKTKLKNGLY